MNEWTLVWAVPLKLVPTAVLSFFYVVGGRSHVIARRLIGGPIFVILCMALAKFELKSLVIGLIVPALFLGYGGESFAQKFIRRMAYGAALGAGGLITGLAFGNWILGIFQFSLALQASLILGLTNPDDAVDEEALIAILSVLLIPFIVA